MSRHLSILIILFILLVLLRFYNSRTSEGFSNAGKSVVICKADWCGHCKTAAPEFNKLVEASPITLKDGSKATIKILDADKDKGELSQYKVKGFPTVLIIDGDVTTEYPGKRTANDITEFLNSNS